MPPGSAAYNHDPYPPAFDGAELQIIDVYYTLDSFSTVDGFSDPHSAWLQKANSLDAPPTLL